MQWLRSSLRDAENIVKTLAVLINLMIMKKSPLILLAGFLVSGVLATRAAAEPIDFSEVSLLVRAHESQPSIIQEVSRRKLVHPLTAQQENTLKTQGANDSLVQALRRSENTLAAADASAFENRRDQRRQAQLVDRAGTESADGAENLHVFNVAFGHPVNLSQWGGPDYELAFNEPTRLDEGQEDAVLINNFGSYTHVATYLGAGRPDDSTTIFDRRNYVSVVEHSLVRGLRIDRRNPVWRKGVPYTLYPVYAAGGVSLYFIGNTGDSVKLAVSTAER